MDFAEWLLEKLRSKGWSRTEFARRGGVSASAVDKVINRSSMPGLVFYKAAAQAFEMDLVDVLRYAGEYSGKSPSVTFEDWIHILEQLPRAEREELLEIARMKLRRQQENEARARMKPRPAEG